ncbi:hypothetical protein L226DRAFT_567793 [Lentinus tigrinus ALCF2SS1-7]|uniref:uncharacterized protein n=1 Tax=Lentinus tigrinus ALCF2SS1-7 TaxID=1328758 RepID=UPI00116624FD|nr:hypothetical protein L226DRAFT_567793 [Lentinus tigrinus ALCF2SS1-7]
MPSAKTIAVIQDIKYNVEKPHLCGWLDHFESNQSKRIRAERYVDGAMRIVDLLRNELPLVDIRQFERRYEHFISLPDNWLEERLHCAREMWDFVVAIDELLSVSRISSVYDDHSDSETYYSASPAHSPKRREASPSRHVQFANTPDVYTWSPSSCGQPAVPATPNSWWWPNWYSWYGNPSSTLAWVPSIVPTPQAGWCMSYAPMTCVAPDRWPHIIW